MNGSTPTDPQPDGSPLKPEPIVRTPARPKGERPRGRWLALLLVLVVLIALVVVPFLLLRPRANVYRLRSYQAAHVQVGDLSEVVHAAGTLVPREQRTVLASSTGTLVAWKVAAGDDVSAGDVVGRLESNELGRDVEQAQANVAEAQRNLAEANIEQSAANRAATRTLEEGQASLAEATNKRDLASQLYAIGATSKQELDTAEATLTAAQQAVDDGRASQVETAHMQALRVAGAEAALEHAQDGLEQARIRLEELVLRAPISGRVIALAVEAGQAVDNGTPLATIASVKDLDVNANVSEAQARLVRVGQSAEVAAAGDSYDAVVTAVSPKAQASGDGGSVVPVTLALQAPPAGLPVGTSASVDIQVGVHEDALYLPRGPYLTTGGERLAYIVEGDSASRHNVIYGLVDGDKVEVRSGLQEGDKVITSSYEAFKDRTSINLAPEGEIP